MCHLTNQQRKEWQSAIHYLKASLQIPATIHVRTKPLKKDDGYAKQIGDDILIIVSSYLDWPNRIETVIHEFAHALHWANMDKRTKLKSWEDTHNDHWGQAYAQVYRQWHQWKEAYYA